MSLLEFLIFGIYLAMLALGIVGVQLLEQMRLANLQHLSIEDTQDKVIDSELEEPESDDEQKPFNPDSEDYTMTENPMLRHRNVEQQVSAVEMVD
jgi:hypothetical protein